MNSSHLSGWQNLQKKNGHKEMAADPKILEVGSQDLVWHHYLILTSSRKNPIGVMIRLFLC